MSSCKPQKDETYPIARNGDRGAFGPDLEWQNFWDVHPGDTVHGGAEEQHVLIVER